MSNEWLAATIGLHWAWAWVSVANNIWCLNCLIWTSWKWNKFKVGVSAFVSNNFASWFKHADTKSRLSFHCYSVDFRENSICTNEYTLNPTLQFVHAGNLHSAAEQLQNNRHIRRKILKQQLFLKDRICKTYCCDDNPVRSGDVHAAWELWRSSPNHQCVHAIFINGDSFDQPNTEPSKTVCTGRNHARPHKLRQR